MKIKILNFWLLLALGMATMVFNSCGNSGGSNNSATTDADMVNLGDLNADIGIIINGVKWATCNVDAPGTFAATPESFGVFYQWNRKTAWSATEPSTDIAIDNWNATLPTDTIWKKSNDPCPKGWRVPTQKELLSLFDTKKVSTEWTTQNGVTGRKFTDKSIGNSIFLPAVGNRKYSDGTLYYVGEFGYYWSSIVRESNEESTYFLGFSEDGALVSYCNRSHGFSVRAVAE